MGIENIFSKEVLESGANLATILALVFVAWQIRMAKNEQKLQHNKQERLKAIELAELYSEKLIVNITYLCKVYADSGIQDKFRNIKYHELKEFDKYELKTIFSENEIDEINKAMANINTDILINASICLSSNSKKDELDCLLEARSIDKTIKNLYEVEEQISATHESDEITRNKEILKNRNKINERKGKKSYYALYYDKLYVDTLNETLNTLEYFCMYFNSQVADEETVYQSLHQSFLSMVKILYFRIASRNENGKDKYYTNIIQLYNKWSKRYYEHEKNEINASRTIVHKQKNIKR
ncbi:DUF4760 domain-containing protein [Clostridium tertium]|uniref:DUF4760 domain-containing protein n=1 Tax=Clostridium tertium TaxID=1559 RepID=UPI00374F20C3